MMDSSCKKHQQFLKSYIVYASSNFFFQDGDQYVLKVWTFEQINNVLKVAGEGKCREAQACLEGKLLILKSLQDQEFRLFAIR